MVNRVVKYGLIAVACALPALLAPEPASAISWAKRGSDGKVCRVLVAPHMHVGIGGDARSERAARAAAVRHWRNFTIWEYGRAWGNVSLARSKSLNCAHVLIGWRCLFVAQPCRS